MILIEKKLLIDREKEILDDIVNFFIEEQKTRIHDVIIDENDEDVCFSYDGNLLCELTSAYLDITQYVIEQMQKINA